MIDTIADQLTPANILTKDTTSNENTFSAGVDIQDYVGQIKFTLASPGSDDADSNIAVALYHSDESDANFVAIGSTGNFTTFDNSAAVLESLDLHTRSLKRYVGAQVTHTGSNGNGGVVSLTLSGFKVETA